MNDNNKNNAIEKEDEKIKQKFTLEGEELKKEINRMKKIPWWYRFAPMIVQNLTWPIGKLLLIIFTKIKVEGKHNLKEAKRLKRINNSGVIFVANHISELDPIVILAGIPPFTALSPMFYVSLPMRFYKMTKRYGWRTLFYGPVLFYLYGAHPIIWGTKDYRISLTRHIELLTKKGVSLCIFPQGGIAREENSTGIDKVHGGTGYLAHKTGSVVVPVAIIGTKNLSLKDFLLRKKQVIVRYGKPLSKEEIEKIYQSLKNKENPYKELTKEIANKVKEML